eukprot:scaffold13157_cov41-Cyclotella_meneghiniana.AAC.2
MSRLHLRMSFQRELLSGNLPYTPFYFNCRVACSSSCIPCSTTDIVWASSSNERHYCLALIDQTLLQKDCTFPCLSVLQEEIERAVDCFNSGNRNCPWPLQYYVLHVNTAEYILATPTHFDIGLLVSTCTAAKCHESMADSASSVLDIMGAKYIICGLIAEMTYYVRVSSEYGEVDTTFLVDTNCYSSVLVDLLVTSFELQGLVTGKSYYARVASILSFEAPTDFNGATIQYFVVGWSKDLSIEESEAPDSQLELTRDCCVHPLLSSLHAMPTVPFVNCWNSIHCELSSTHWYYLENFAPASLILSATKQFTIEIESYLHTTLETESSNQLRMEFAFAAHIMLLSLKPPRMSILFDSLLNSPWNCTHGLPPSRLLTHTSMCYSANVDKYAVVATVNLSHTCHYFDSYECLPTCLLGMVMQWYLGYKVYFECAYGVRSNSCTSFLKFMSTSPMIRAKFLLLVCASMSSHWLSSHMNSIVNSTSAPWNTCSISILRLGIISTFETTDYSTASASPVLSFQRCILQNELSIPPIDLRLHTNSTAIESIYCLNPPSLVQQPSFTPSSDSLHQMISALALSFTAFVFAADNLLRICLRHQRELHISILYTLLEFKPTDLPSSKSFCQITWCSTVLEGEFLGCWCSLLNTHSVNSFPLQKLLDAILNLHESGNYVEGKIEFQLLFQPNFLASEGDKLPTAQGNMCLTASVKMSVLGSRGSLHRSECIRFYFCKTPAWIILDSVLCYMIQVLCCTFTNSRDFVGGLHETVDFRWTCFHVFSLQCLKCPSLHKPLWNIRLPSAFLYMLGRVQYLQQGKSSPFYSVSYSIATSQRKYNQKENHFAGMTNLLYYCQAIQSFRGSLHHHTAPHHRHMIYQHRHSTSVLFVLVAFFMFLGFYHCTRQRIKSYHGILASTITKHIEEAPCINYKFNSCCIGHHFLSFTSLFYFMEFQMLTVRSFHYDWSHTAKLERECDRSTKYLPVRTQYSSVFHGVRCLSSFAFCLSYI